VPNGALLASTDSENGAYAFAMNDLNQLVSACNPNCTGYALKPTQRRRLT